MVKHGGAFVESSRVPRIGKAELFVVEMMAKLVAKGAQERTERGDLFSHRRSHPHAHHDGFGSVVSEQFGRPLFASSQRSSGEYPDAALWNSVELGCGFQNFAQDWRTLVVSSAFMADSIDFVISGKHSSSGRSSVLIRSLSRKPARFELRGGQSVNMGAGVIF